MKFFRATAPVLVALAVCLGIAPAFAVAAPDSPDTYAPEIGEVLTDDPDSSASAGANPVLDDTRLDTDSGGNDITVHSHISVTDIDGVESTPGTVPPDSGTLPGFLRSMFGEYTPKTQTVTTYYDGELLDVSTEYVPGFAGIDVEWLASVILFGIVVYCLFRMLGGMVR